MTPASQGLDLQVQEIRERKGQRWLEASGKSLWRCLGWSEAIGEEHRVQSPGHVALGRLLPLPRL